MNHNFTCLIYYLSSLNFFVSSTWVMEVPLHYVYTCNQCNIVQMYDWLNWLQILPTLMNAHFDSTKILTEDSGKIIEWEEFQLS
jgi:hypothetical protein